MKTKIYHGNLDRQDVAETLASIFNRGTLTTQVTNNSKRSFVQIRTQQMPLSGGNTSLNIALKQIDDRLEVQVGQQSLLSVAASLGKSAWLVLRNPLNLLGRIDDIAQDIEHLELDDQVWQVIDQIASNANASHDLSDRL